MENNRNLVLTIVVTMAILFGWQIWENYRRTGVLSFTILPTATQTSPQTGATSNNSTASSGTPDAAINAEQKPNQMSNAPSVLLPAEAAILQSSRVTIENAHIRGSLNLQGARLDDLLLKDYRKELSPTSPAVRLLAPHNAEDGHFAEFGWVKAGQNATAEASLGTLPDHNSLWQASQTSLKPQQILTLTWVNEVGTKFSQSWQLDDDNMFTVRQEIMAKNGLPIKDNLLIYGRVQQLGIPADTAKMYILHEGLVGFLNEGLEELKYDKLLDKPQGRVNFDSKNGWLGITSKYWFTGLIPDQTSANGFQASMTGVKAESPAQKPIFQADFLMKPNQDGVMTSHLFAGAKRTVLLDRYEKELSIKGFDHVIDFGWFYFLTKPMYYALHWFNNLLGSFGLAILLLTVCVKLVMFPLANKSYHSMSKMRLLQPKMAELKTRYGDDRAKLNQATMELYKTEKVNPMAGCLPLFVQIPVFFSLYKVLYVAIEMRHAPFYGWIHDLSAPDPYGLLTLFGLFSWSVPQFLAIVNIGVWPILMGITMWMQMRLNPAPADPIQQKMFALMPLVFTFMLGSFAVGMVIYWTWNNILSIIQQSFIMRKDGVNLKRVFGLDSLDGWLKSKRG